MHQSVIYCFPPLSSQHPHHPCHHTPFKPYLFPLAVGREFLGRDEEAESENRFELSRQPLRFKVFKLCLGLPKHWHIQTQAEHISESATQVPPYAATRGRKQMEWCGASFRAKCRGNAGKSHDTCLWAVCALLPLATQALPFYLKGKGSLCSPLPACQLDTGSLTRTRAADCLTQGFWKAQAVSRHAHCRVNSSQASHLIPDQSSPKICLWPQTRQSHAELGLAEPPKDFFLRGKTGAKAGEPRRPFIIPITMFGCHFWPQIQWVSSEQKPYLYRCFYRAQHNSTWSSVSVIFIPYSFLFIKRIESSAFHVSTASNTPLNSLLCWEPRRVHVWRKLPCRSLESLTNIQSNREGVWVMPALFGGMLIHSSNEMFGKTVSYCNRLLRCH